MLARFKEIDWQPGARAIRRFGAGFLWQAPIAGLVWFAIVRLFSGHWNPWVPAGFAIAGLVVGGLALVAPPAARPLYRLWWALVCVLEAVVTTVALSLAFVLVFVPAGLVMRLAGRDPLHRRFEKDKESYWIKAEKTADPGRYYRQF